MKLLYMRASRSRGYLVLGIAIEEEKLAFTVSEADYAELGSPRVGDRISEDALGFIKRSDEGYRARLCALRILSYADNNEATLCRKLIMKKISPETARAVSREMTSLGYINEDEQIKRAVVKEANINLLGPKKIRAKLCYKGFDSDAVDLAIESLVLSGEIDFTLSSKRLAAKKLARGASEQEIKMLLYKNGYDIC